VPAGEPVNWGALLPPAVRFEAAKDDPNAREYLARLQALGYIAGSAAVGGTPAAAPTPAETLLAVMNRGTVLLEKGDIQGALVAYRSATDMAPGFAGAWLRLATPQRHLGDLEGALVSYRRAYSVAREDSHRESALLGQGIVLDQLHRTGEALNVLRNGVEELPESFILWNTLGGLLLKSREREEARQALERATALREDPDTLNSLATLELALGGDPAKARRLWQRSLELRPGQQDVERALRELQR
jgi:tetratricopeptide (TPR) repeat protein